MTTDHAIEATFAPAAPAVNARYLAEGSMDRGMETWVLAQNPNPRPVTVDISLMTGEGERPGPQGYVVDAGRRATFIANDYVTDYHVSALVASRGGGVVRERAMYGPPGRI